MRRYRFVVAILVFLAVAATITGCGTAPAPTVARGEPAAVPTQPRQTATPTSTPSREPQGEKSVTRTPTPKATKTKLSTDTESLFDRARADLAERLGLQLEAIQRIAVESVKWPDTSLGCPQPDQMYAQVITPGYRVVLKAGGQVYRYHADQRDRLVLCEEEPKVDEASPTTPTPSGPVESGIEALVDQAKEDLAGRLSISVEGIEILEAKPVIWPDGSLGCPQPGMAYTQVQVEGVLIRLRAGQRDYSYHGGAGKAPFLCLRATAD